MPKFEGMPSPEQPQNTPNKPKVESEEVDTSYVDFAEGKFDKSVEDRAKEVAEREAEDQMKIEEIRESLGLEPQDKKPEENPELAEEEKWAKEFLGGMTTEQLIAERQRLLDELPKYLDGQSDDVIKLRGTMERQIARIENNPKVMEKLQVQAGKEMTQAELKKELEPQYDEIEKRVVELSQGFYEQSLRGINPEVSALRDKLLELNKRGFGGSLYMELVGKIDSDMKSLYKQLKQQEESLPNQGRNQVSMTKSQHLRSTWNSVIGGLDELLDRKNPWG